MSRTVGGLRSRPGTLADLDALRPATRAELIAGVLYELPMTTFDHDDIKGDVSARLRFAYQLGQRGPGGWWILPEGEFVARGREVLRPDVVGWRKSRMPERPSGRRADVVPDWVLEVLSKSTRHHDLRTKRDAYARISVRHRWYVDPDVRVLQTFELARGRWVETGVFSDEDVVSVAPFEAVTFDMKDWWAKPTLARRPRGGKPSR